MLYVIFYAIYPPKPKFSYSTGETSNIKMCATTVISLRVHIIVLKKISFELLRNRLMFGLLLVAPEPLNQF